MYFIYILITRPILLDSSSKNVEQQFFHSSPSNLVLDTVKFAEDAVGSKILLRLYEAYGGRGIGKLITSLKIKEAYFCNILEDQGKEVEFDDSGALLIPYTPFKIISILLYL